MSSPILFNEGFFTGTMQSRDIKKNPWNKIRKSQKKVIKVQRKINHQRGK